MHYPAPNAARLIWHDGLLAANLIKAAFATWRDRLTLLIAALLLLGFIYDRLLSLPPITARYLCAFAAFALAFAAAKALAHRLDFFRTESVLAMDALSRTPAWRYKLAGMVSAAVPVVLLILLLYPSALPISIAAFLAGGALAGLMDIGGLRALLPHQKAALFVLQAWLARPVSGLVLALLFGALIAIVTPLAMPTDRAPLAAIAAFILALPLAGVNDATVRFMALSGFSAWRSIWHPMRGLLIFTAIAAPVTAIAAGPVAAAVISAIAVALLLMVAMRVLAYRIYGRRIADLIVSILFALLLVAAFTVPLVLPLIIPAILWWLARRARASTWLLA